MTDCVIEKLERHRHGPASGMDGMVDSEGLKSRWVWLDLSEWVRWMMEV